MISRIRAVLSVLVVTVLAGGLVAVTAPMASAGESMRVDLRATWAYTDARTPFRSFVDTGGDAPVGAWRDDDHRFHLSKSYFTFDLSQLQGARIFRVHAFVAEKQANDCSVKRATELWLTDTADRPTWARPPRERARLVGPDEGPVQCVLPGVEWDVTEGLRRALAEGQSRVTLALRISNERQHDFRYGRRYGNDLRLLINYNLPPNVPVDLATITRPCADGPFLTNFTSLLISARVSDPDQNDRLVGRFAVWPVDQPTQRTERVSSVSRSDGYVDVVVSLDVVEHDRTYRWEVRTEDGDDMSPWAGPCEFSTDFVRPDVEPGITSSVYPEDCDPACGGVGIPGELHFTANGVADVVGFYYGPNEQPSTFVEADRPGGSATGVYTPQRDGPQHLYVQSVDRAGNRSFSRLYRFFVRDDSPFVTCAPENGGISVPHECTFAPFMENVATYTYRLGDGPEIVVEADSDQQARVTITPTMPPGNSLTVFSTTSGGVRSTEAWYYFTTAPSVSSEVYPERQQGGGPQITGTFVFRPRLPDVVEYVYSFSGESETSVPAGLDGSAAVDWAPQQSGWVELYVRSRSGDGTMSETAQYAFNVNP